MIAVSTLLKSCAMPPASWPIACIFWLCAKFSCSVRCSVVSSAKTVALAPSSPPGSAAETKSAPSASPAPFERGVDRRDVALAVARGGDRRRASAAWSRSAISRVDRRPRSAGAAFSAAGREAGEGGVGAQERRRGVDRGDRHRRRVEEARKAHLGGAQIASPLLLAGRAVDDQRARRARARRRWKRRRGAGCRAGSKRPRRRLRSTSNCSVVTSPGRPETTTESATPSPATMSASLSRPAPNCARS